MTPLTLIAAALWLGSASALAMAAWNAAAWPRVAMNAGDARLSGTVSVLIPARDEGAHIGPCLEHAAAEGAAVAEILVYDDHSADDTAAVVTEWSARDSRVRLLAPAPLPPDWCGKPFACLCLAQAASGDWLLFLDADARLKPGAAAALVGEAERRNATLLSAWPGLTLASPWEAILMPLLNFTVLTLFPTPLSFRRDLPALGLAHGACILVSRAVYEANGGHGAVHDAVFEDTALARHWRRSGSRGLCLDGQDTVEVRMYDSFSGIWNGFQKNIHAGFERALSFWLFLAGHGAFFVAPLALAAVLPWGPAKAWAAAAVLNGLLARWALALRFRQSKTAVLLHPLAESLLIALGLAAWLRHVLGKGVVWKGRSYRAGKGAKA